MRPNRSLSLVLGSLSLLCFTGCGTPATSSLSSTTLPTPLSTQPMSELPLRQQLETLEQHVRASIQESTPDTFLTLVEQASADPAAVAQFRTRWSEPEAKNALQNFVFPDLTKQKFLEVKQEGDWAGYYYLSDLEQTDRLTINVMRFHKSGDAWKVSTRSGVSSIEAGATEAENQTLIQESLQESDALALVPKS